MPAFKVLTSRARSLDRPGFYHLGTSRQLIESLTQIQNRGSDTPRLHSSRAHPERFVLNSSVDCKLNDSENHTIWIENSTIPASWQMSHEHLITGVPGESFSFIDSMTSSFTVSGILDVANTLRSSPLYAFNK